MSYWYEQQKQTVRFFLARLRRSPFRPDAYDDWYGDEEGAVVVSPRTGGMLGYFTHDGHGKYEIIIYVSWRRALRLVWADDAAFIGFVGGFRCCMSVFRAKDPFQAMIGIQELAGALFREPLLEED